MLLNPKVLTDMNYHSTSVLGRLAWFRSLGTQLILATALTCGFAIASDPSASALLSATDALESVIVPSLAAAPEAETGDPAPGTLQINAQREIRLATEIDVTYAVERSPDLATWVPFGDPIIGDGGLDILPVQEPGEAPQFFRAWPLSYQGLTTQLLDGEPFDVLITHISGERLLIKVDDRTAAEPKVHELVWLSPEDVGFVLRFGPAGQPESAFVQDHIFLFNGYTDTTVDIAAISPDGGFEVFRNVSFPTSGLRKFAGAASDWNHRRLADNSATFEWRAPATYASMIMGVTGCALAGITGGPLAAVLPCGSAMVNVVAALSGDLAWQGVAADLSAYICAVDPTRLSCLSAVLDVTLFVTQSAEQSETALADAIAAARAVLADGTPPNPAPDRLVWIPPGTFTMGSPDDENGRQSDESPLTHVTLTRGFWLGRYEVTQAEYQSVRGMNPSNWKGDNLPVEQVSWNDAVAYCQQLTQQTRDGGMLAEGWEYRLPTEAQWEYACRAGTTTRFHFGETYSDLGDYAWYSGNSSYRTHPVGQKQANAWGLHDMQGNVQEWCMDRYGFYPGGSVSDPTGPTSGLGRVIRGSNWNRSQVQCRSALRSYRGDGSTSSGLGFRVALAPSP